MTSTWFTSDLHFGHFNVIEYSKRPFKDVDEMNAVLIENWNNSVQPGDTIWVLGDITLGKFSAIKHLFETLNGKKYLIQGNHDKFSRSQYQELGFINVFKEVVLNIAGQSCTLSHYPWAPTLLDRMLLKPFPSELRFLDRRPARNGSILLHGHTHSKLQTKGRAIHVGVDAWDYKPVHMKDIIKLIEKVRNESSNSRR